MVYLHGWPSRGRVTRLFYGYLVGMNEKNTMRGEHELIVFQLCEKN